ncbi:MAG: hypothetical protein ACRCVA_06680, partial [Phreatobacter sp.]
MTDGPIGSKKMRLPVQLALIGACAAGLYGASLFVGGPARHAASVAEAGTGGASTRDARIFRPTQSQWASLAVQPAQLRTFRLEFPT